MPDATTSGKDSRRRLLAAARVLFTERGYHETRSQDIVRKAGVGHGTFYLHFADKRECFLAFVDEAAAEIDALVEARTAHAATVADLVMAVLDAIKEYAIAHPGVAVAALADPDVIDPSSIRVAPRLADRWARAWARDLARLAKDGRVATDLDFLIVGHAIVGLIHQTTTTQQRGEFSREDLLKTLIAFIERALAPPQN